MESTVEDAMLDVDKERNSAIRLLKTLMKFIVCNQKINLQPTKKCVWRLLPLICKVSYTIHIDLLRLLLTVHVVGIDNRQMPVLQCLSITGTSYWPRACKYLLLSAGIC